MKRDFITLSDSWSPSSYYDSSTSLIWINSYELFMKVYERKIKAPSDKKYAIHKDVYKAFLYMYKNKDRSSKNTRKTRRKRKHKDTHN